MRRTRPSAFTLLELVVAAGISALIAGFILAVARGCLGAWQRTAGRTGADAEGRFILDRLTDDLQSALYRDDGRVWLVAAVLDRTDHSGRWEAAPMQKPAGAAGGSLRIGPAFGEGERFGQAGMWLCFFAPEDAGAPGLPAPAALGYQIIRELPPGAGPAAARGYYLHRTVVRAAADAGRPGVLESGFDLDPESSPGGYTHATAGNDGTAAGDPFALTSPQDPATVLAGNVIDFGVRLYRRNGGALERIFPLDDSDRLHLARAPAGAAAPGDAFPEVAELVVRVLTEEGAREIATLETHPERLGTRPSRFADDAAWWWDVAEAHSRLCVRRIALPAPLSP